MIDLKQELQDYRIINLNDISQNESDIPDNMRNSIFLYNKAIESLRNGSEDIAIIELKKAISMNPHFYEAMNLLGICYSYIKDNAKAAEVFEKVVKAEHNSVNALRYLSLMNSNEVPGQGRQKIKNRASLQKVRETLSQKRATGEKGKKPLWQEGVKYLAAFSAGLLVFFLIQALGMKPVDKISNGNTTDVVTTDNTGDQFKQKYEELLPKYELLQKDKDTANAAVDYYKSVIKLYEIESLANKKQYTGAADLLLLMKTVEFDGNDKARFDSLYSLVMPKAAWVIYDDGYKLYNTKKYAEALKKLEKVEIYDPKFSRLDAVMYYMGKSYQLLNDSRNAIALYQRLIEAYPKGSYALNAKSKIKMLTRQP